MYTPAVLHVDVEHASLYLERVDGQCVKHALHAGSLPADEICRVMKEIGQAVAKLHDGGIIHGDLTTSNIMLRPDGRVVRVPPPVCMTQGRYETRWSLRATHHQRALHRHLHLHDSARPHAPWSMHYIHYI